MYENDVADGVITEDIYNTNSEAKKLKDKEIRRQIKKKIRIERKKNKMAERRLCKDNRNEHRRECKKIRERHRKEKDEINGAVGELKWYNLFTRWFAIGIILILFSLCITFIQTTICATDKTGFKILNGFLQIIIGLLSSVGIALLVGSVFDFSKNSEAFTSFVSNIIKKIIVTKEFLCEIKSEEKRKVLEMLISPTDSQIEQCSSINLYYKKSIDDFFDLYKQPFKTNLTINMFAKIEDEIVVCEGNITSRRYKTNGEFQPVITGFEKGTSEMNNEYVLLPNGKKHTLSADEEPYMNNDSEGKGDGKKFISKIPDEMNKYPYITVGKDIKEFGTKDLILFNWSSLTPCDGVSFELNCAENLTIETYKIFDDHNLYEVDINKQRNNIRIVSNSWLSKYTGFTLLIKRN